MGSVSSNMPRLRQAVVLVAALLWLSACTGSKLGGAEGFGGGDSFNDVLRSLRRGMLTWTVADIAAGGNTTLLCELDLCPDPQKSPCKNVPSFSPHQKSFCRDFLVSKAGELKKRLESDRITVTGVAGSLLANGQEVTAIAPYAEEGEIQVSHTRVVNLGYERLDVAAILAHEFTHMIAGAVDGDYLRDLKPIPPYFDFPDGGSLLATGIGYAIVLHAMAMGFDTSEDGAPRAASVTLSGGPVLNFGNLQTGASESRTVTVSNTGHRTATDVTVGALASPFAVKGGTCRQGQSLTASDSCSLTLVFETKEEREIVDRLAITYKDGTATQLVLLAFRGKATAPTRLDFGGMYGTYPPTGFVINNPITQAPSCPAGYSESKIHGQIDLDTYIFFCSREHVPGRDEEWDLGGFHGTGAENNYANPATGDLSCPPGYSEGRVTSDHALSFCYRQHLGGRPGALRFGGMWGYSGAGPYPNPVTNGATCPQDYVARKIFGTSGRDFDAHFCYHRLDRVTLVDLPGVGPPPPPPPPPDPCQGLGGNYSGHCQPGNGAVLLWVSPQGNQCITGGSFVQNAVLNVGGGQGSALVYPPAGIPMNNLTLLFSPGYFRLTGFNYAAEAWFACTPP